MVAFSGCPIPNNNPSFSKPGWIWFKTLFLKTCNQRKLLQNIGFVQPISGRKICNLEVVEELFGMQFPNSIFLQVSTYSLIRMYILTLILTTQLFLSSEGIN